VEHAGEACQELRKAHVGANEDEKTVDQLDPGGKISASLEAAEEHATPEVAGEKSPAAGEHAEKKKGVPWCSHPEFGSTPKTAPNSANTRALVDRALRARWEDRARQRQILIPKVGLWERTCAADSKRRERPTPRMRGCPKGGSGGCQQPMLRGEGRARLVVFPSSENSLKQRKSWENLLTSAALPVCLVGSVTA